VSSMPELDALLPKIFIISATAEYPGSIQRTPSFYTIVKETFLCTRGLSAVDAGVQPNAFPLLLSSAICA